MANQESKVFISYSRKDEEFALSLGKDLKEKGINIWLDKLDIKPGQTWDREVEKALEICELFLIILSQDSVSSENVMNELDYSLTEKKNVIPVLYKNCKIPLGIRRKQFCDFTKDYDKGFNDLLKAFDINITNKQSIRGSMDILKDIDPSTLIPGVKDAADKANYILQAVFKDKLVQIDILKGSIKKWNHLRVENPEISINLSRGDFKNADLRNADLNHVNLGRADFKNADLRNADLNHANLSSADFRNADLRETNLGGAEVTGTNFTVRNGLNDIGTLTAFLEQSQIDNTYYTGIPPILPEGFNPPQQRIGW